MEKARNLDELKEKYEKEIEDTINEVLGKFNKVMIFLLRLVSFAFFLGLGYNLTSDKSIPIIWFALIWLILFAFYLGIKGSIYRDIAVELMMNRKNDREG